MVDQAEQEGLLAGTLRIQTQGEEPTNLVIERYVKGSDFLTLTFLEREGERVLISGGAKYQGQIWGASMMMGWVPAEKFKEDIGGLPTEDGDLEKAEVSATQDVLNGVPMTTMTVVWDSAEYDPEEGGEGKVTVTLGTCLCRRMGAHRGSGGRQA